MKKIAVLLSIVFFPSTFAQTVDFDTESNWTAGSGILSSYQTDHQFNETISGYGVNFTGGEALRQTAGTQDGFSSTFNSSTYAWRLRNVATVSWIVTLTATSVNGFSFRVRRWDGSPSPNFDVSFSSDGGTNWSSVGTIDNNFLANSSDWSLFNYGTSISATSNIIVRIQANGTTERIMIDDFNFDSPLPVELSSFSAYIIEDGVKLNWVTETEVSNYGFEILRSVHDDEWNVLGFVEGYGNSNSPKEYSFIDNNVTGGTYSYRLKQIDTDGKFEYSKVIEIDVGTPLNYELTQNYPNPFNPSTTIKFSLPEGSAVSLKIYNSLGQQIKTLVNRFMEAGVHTVKYNAIGLNSGMYFYRLDTGEFSQVRKMTLIK